MSKHKYGEPDQQTLTPCRRDLSAAVGIIHAVLPHCDTECAVAALLDNDDCPHRAIEHLLGTESRTQCPPPYPTKVHIRFGDLLDEGMDIGHDASAVSFYIGNTRAVGNAATPPMLLDLRRRQPYTRHSQLNRRHRSRARRSRRHNC